MAANTLRSQSQLDTTKSQSPSSKSQKSKASEFIKYSEKAKLIQEHVKKQEKRIDSLRKEIYLQYKTMLDKKQSGIFMENQPMRYPRGYIPLEDTVISNPYQPENFWEHIYNFLSDYLPSFQKLKFLRSKRVIYRKHSNNFGMHIKAGILSYEMLSYAPLVEVSTGIQAGYKYRTPNYLIQGFIVYNFGRYTPWLPIESETRERNYTINGKELLANLRFHVVAHVDYYNGLEYQIGLGLKYRMSSYQKHTEIQNHFAYKSWLSPIFSITVEKSFRRRWKAKVTLESILGTYKHQTRYSLSGPYTGSQPLQKNTPDDPFSYAWKRSLNQLTWSSLGEVQNFSNLLSVTYALDRNLSIGLSYRFDFLRELDQRNLIQTQNTLLINWYFFW